MCYNEFKSENDKRNLKRDKDGELDKQALE